MNDVGNFPMAGGCYTKWHASRLELMRQASLTTRAIVGLVYILLPKMVVVLACFAYTRQRSTRGLWLHLLLVVLSVASGLGRGRGRGRGDRRGHVTSGQVSLCC